MALAEDFSGEKVFCQRFVQCYGYLEPVYRISVAACLQCRQTIGQWDIAVTTSATVLGRG